MLKKIIVRGAREHNLQNVDVALPRDSLVVITGLSGSGKSSLAFDTIYAEGQRRYVESLSAYARQFLELMQKPDVDSIEGLSPAISIEQKTTSRNPRSTVGTVTEIYDYLRLLFARTGVPYSPTTGLPIEAQSVSQMVDIVMAMDEGTRLYLLAPIARRRKGEYRRELAELQKRGFQRVKIDGEMYEIDEAPALDKNYWHDIEVVVDRVVVRPDLETRLADSLETALELADGLAFAEDADGGAQTIFSAKFACPVSGFTIEEIEPRLFSFNNPHGACPACDGLGTKVVVDPDLVVPDENKSLRDGAVAPWANSSSPYYAQTLDALARHYKVSAGDAWRELPKKVRQAILYGSGETPVKMKYDDGLRTYETTKPFEGVVNNLERRYRETESSWAREEIAKFQTTSVCEVCEGARLKPEALAVKIDGRHISQVTEMSIAAAADWFRALPGQLTEKQLEIGQRILREINERLGFLNDVGLEYLTLDRAAGTLSGGESQRIRLASQIGSGLTGVLYVLDEPSIGLHQRDNARLLETLKRLRDLGNTVIVVEHDEEAIRSADFLVDMGPGAGVHGGEVVAHGTPKKVMQQVQRSLTAQYLTGLKQIPVPELRRPGKEGQVLRLIGATANNLQKVNGEIPLGTFTCITGVSGSGKSSLIIDTLYRAAARQLMKARAAPGPFTALEGLEHLDKVIDIDQSPPGDLYRRLFADPRLVHRPAGIAGARLQAGPLLVQRQGRPLRGLPGRRRDQDRDALSARRLRRMRHLRRQALQPRNAGGGLPRQVDRRCARHDGRRRPRVLQGSTGDPQQARYPGAGRARLHSYRPAGDHPVGRRGAAGQAGQGTGAPGHRQDALYPRRADHRPALRRRAQAARRAARAGRARQHRGRDRTQSRGHQDRRLDRRSRPRRRRQGRPHRRVGDA
jgi:excinuclease ABC subunit A